MRKLMLAVMMMFSTGAQAYTQAKSQSGAPLHWTDGSVTIHVDADAASEDVGDAQVAAALDGALAVWTQAMNARVHLLQGATQAMPQGDPIVCWVRFVHEGWPLAADQLASTQLWAHDKSGAITAAIISVNEQDHRFAADGRVDATDLQAVLTHEVGHLLGLGHSVDQSATMFVSTAMGDLHQRQLGADDLAGLEAAYPDTAAPAAPGSASMMTASAPAGTGCSVAGHAAPGFGFAPLAILFAVAFARRRRVS